MVEIDAFSEEAKSYEATFKPMFIEEATINLGQMNSDLLALETDPSNDDLIDNLFRKAHTLKAGAGMVGFGNFVIIAHRLEDRLAELKSHQQVVSPKLIDNLLEVFNEISNFLVVGDDTNILSLLALPGLNEPSDIAIDSPVVANIPTAAIATKSQKETTASPSPSTTAKEVAPTALPEVLPQPPVKKALPEVIVSAPASQPLLPISHLDDALALIDEASAAQLALGKYFPNPESLPAYRHLTLRLKQLQDAALTSRMVPAGELFPIWRKGLRDAAQLANKKIDWEASGEAVLLDRAVREQLRDPLLQIIRNAAAHGVEVDRDAAGKSPAAKLSVEVVRLGSEVAISIRDDGAGINLERIRTVALGRGIEISNLSAKQLIDLIFMPGFSTAPTVNQAAGRGVGLDIVAAAITKLRGRIQVQTSSAGTEFTITVPSTLAVVPCYLIQIGEQQFGLPETGVVTLGDYVASPSHLGSLIGLPFNSPTATVVLADADHSLTLSVDALLGRRDVIVRPLRGPLPKMDILSGVGLNPDGSILIILDPTALIAHSFGHRLSSISA